MVDSTVLSAEVVDLVQIRNCAAIASDRQMGVRGVPWEQDTPMGTVWHRSGPAPAPERVSHCTLAQAHLGRLAGIVKG
jgi:hypothetical protein